MARPVCPLCRDNFSVAKVSALYRSQLSAHAALFAPPPVPGPVGRLVALALMLGGLLWVVSGFTAVWLPLALCLGVVAEIVVWWERAPVHAEQQQAFARWQAAYYCGRHDVVFRVGQEQVYSPAQFAQLLQVRSGPGDLPVEAPSAELPSTPRTNPSIRPSVAPGVEAGS